MRYIRTKEGIIFDTKYEPKAFKYNFNVKFIVDNNNLIVYDTVFKDRIANHGEILNQADTIEELCDEFVIETDREKYVYNKGFRELQREYDVYDSSYGLLKIINKYGAIWTDKGLIYVAKMNEKGELELL